MREDVIEVMASGIAQEGGFKSRTFPENLSRAALAALEAAGCMVVPREPTEGMVKAGVGLAFRIRLSPEYSWKDYMTDLYRAMLAAAPMRGEG